MSAKPAYEFLFDLTLMAFGPVHANPKDELTRLRRAILAAWRTCKEYEDELEELQDGL
ncbi:hypothetical protein ACL1FZ_08500 [Corynebacterium striatum]